MVSMESIPDIFGFVKFFAKKLAYCGKGDTLNVKRGIIYEFY